jgi:oxygen-independent coproporphyrinogen-3 oxidase
LLERLGRVHSRAQVFKSFDILRAAGFENVNVDLMFAIPGQTMEIWRETLNEAIAMQSEHLSTYEVIYEDDTPLFHQLQAGEIDVDEDLACDMYNEIVALVSLAGFSQYEIANFGRHLGDLNDDIPDYACLHNVNYWRGGSHYGLGPAASGLVHGVRTKNWSNTQLYCEQLERGQRAIESSEELPPLKRAGETAAFGLRMNAGWPFEVFKRATQFDLREGWDSEMQQLIEREWGARDEHRFQLTSKGLRFADSAAELFLR